MSFFSILQSVIRKVLKKSTVQARKVSSTNHLPYLTAQRQTSTQAFADPVRHNGPTAFVFEFRLEETLRSSYQMDDFFRFENDILMVKMEPSTSMNCEALQTTSRCF
ncbi:uncharacterized protein TM35_000361140 [Trypanosoma theileri]|uniref:Uncharacterized protein n=1 Tax=Trypanosoma theileri TaxID=67003 RepID=A0A1X0NKF8_9TRYP|nr:uncharacterized protein TM35_000361140 [Trypanosoma theileri]ORC85254.1 hypothetical protein TM35_000361140 [Trypanosoma theileri]